MLPLHWNFKPLGWRIVAGGTDSHLFLVDTLSGGIGGKSASEKLERSGIIVNKNTIPYDTQSPVNPSGIRIGTPAVTTLQMNEEDMKKIAALINDALTGKPARSIKESVHKLLQ